VVEDEVFGRGWCGEVEGGLLEKAGLVGGEEAGVLGGVNLVERLEGSAGGGVRISCEEGVGGGAGGEFGEFFEAVVVVLEAGGEIGGVVAGFGAPGEDEAAVFAVGAGEGADAGEQAEVRAAEEVDGLAGSRRGEGDEAAGGAVWQAEDGGSGEDEAGVLGVCGGILEALLDGRIGECGWSGLERCGEGDGFDLAEGDGAAALVVGLGRDEIGGLDGEAGLGGGGWGDLWEFVEDASGGGDFCGKCGQAGGCGDQRDEVEDRFHGKFIAMATQWLLPGDKERDLIAPRQQVPTSTPKKRRTKPRQLARRLCLSLGG
jgi:hypothetical protein